MVIFLEGIPVNQVPCSTEDLYSRFPKIAEKGLEFCSQNCVQVQKEHTLYIGQGEFGVVPASDPRVKYVGSEDATTCHVIVVRHPSGTVGVAHFDGSKNEEGAINCIVSKISQIENGVDALELYVIGGYVPEEGSKESKKNESERLSVKILNLFSRHKCKFNLSLWCTCRLNTKQESNGPRPAVYGVAVDVASGTVFPASFQSHDPDLPLRSASRWMSESSKLYDLYDHVSGTITIDPFYYSDVDCFSFYVGLPDDVILSNFSTSPKVEPPSFCQELREVFRVFVKHPTPHVTLFPSKKPKRYSMNSNGLWESLKE